MPLINIPSMQAIKFNKNRDDFGYTITNCGDAIFQKRVFTTNISKKVYIEKDQCSREALIPYDFQDCEFDESQNKIHIYKIHMYPPNPSTSYCNDKCPSRVPCPIGRGNKFNLESRMSTDCEEEEATDEDDPCQNKEKVSSSEVVQKSYKKKN